ncbi:MAG: alpha/beta hydrolase [Chloroflexota bacterium]
MALNPWPIGIALVVLYVSYVTLIFFLQRRILFSGQRQSDTPRKPNTVPNLESWWVSITDGLVEAWFIPGHNVSNRNPGPAVIYMHGHEEQIDDWPKHLSGFINRGISLLMVEYPGYGRSDGSPSQWQIEEAVTGAYDQLAGRPEVDSMRIVAYGRSLGGGAACQLALNRTVAGLILESTFTNARHLLTKYMLPGFLMRDTFDNLSAVQDYNGPILIMHGTKDSTIPPSHAKKLAQNAPQSNLVLYYCRHNDCPPNVTHYWMDLATFLQQAEILVM